MKRSLRIKVMVICILIITLMAKAKKSNVLNMQQTIPLTTESSSSRKKFTSVEIMQGDTLWSIAEDNKTGNYTTKALIEEIKLANGLSGDRIIEGNYLIVSYYD